MPQGRMTSSNCVASFQPQYADCARIPGRKTDALNVDGMPLSRACLSFRLNSSIEPRHEWEGLMAAINLKGMDVDALLGGTRSAIPIVIHQRRPAHAHPALLEAIGAAKIEIEKRKTRNEQRRSRLNMSRLEGGPAPQLRCLVGADGRSRRSQIRRGEFVQ